jgi:hypothetical protein
LVSFRISRDHHNSCQLRRQNLSVHKFIWSNTTIRLKHGLYLELPNPVRCYAGLNIFSNEQKDSQRMPNSFLLRMYQNIYTDTWGFQVEPHIEAKDLPRLTCQMRNNLPIWKPCLQDTGLSHKA